MAEFTACDLTFMCRNKWEELQATHDAHVRYCGNCAQGVFAVRTRAQLSVACAAGRCVALTNDNQITGWVGQPDSDWDMFEEETETVRIRFGDSFVLGQIQRLRLAFPRAAQETIEWGAGIWILLGTFTPYVAKRLRTELGEQSPGVEIMTEQGAV